MKKNDNIPLIIVVLLAMLLLFSFGWGFGHMGGMILFGPILMVSVLVLIVWLVIYLTQNNRR